MSLLKILNITVMFVTCSTNYISESQGVTSSDLSMVINSVLFVDRTFLIRDLMNEFVTMKKITNYRVVKVLTPPKYGKSTNNNMIKRFFDIPVDSDGTALNITESKNYLLFSKNNLDIYHDKDFFNTNFGTKPVITIDFKSLRNVESFESLLSELRNIIKSTFKEHEYLLHVNQLWDQHFNKTVFSAFFDEKQITQLHQYNIFCSFSLLSQILYYSFRTKVLVLIDDFDAIEESPAYKEESEKNKICTYMGVLFSDVLLSNKHLFAAMLTGSAHLGKLHLKKVSGSEKPYTDISDITERHNNTLWKYYGISKHELEHLLNKFIQDPEKVIEAKVKLSEYHYNGKVVNCNPYSVSSVMQYLKKNKILNFKY